jgi:hypothetical protein
MPQNSSKKGIIIFAALILLFIGISLTAYYLSGNKGIEERFSEAIGIEGDGEEENGGIFGFKIEGNITFYLIMLIFLAVACLLIYLLC